MRRCLASAFRGLFFSLTSFPRPSTAFTAFSHCLSSACHGLCFTALLRPFTACLRYISSACHGRFLTALPQPSTARPHTHSPAFHGFFFTASPRPSNALPVTIWSFFDYLPSACHGLCFTASLRPSNALHVTIRPDLAKLPPSDRATPAPAVRAARVRAPPSTGPGPIPRAERQVGHGQLPSLWRIPTAAVS